MAERSLSRRGITLALVETADPPVAATLELQCDQVVTLDEETFIRLEKLSRKAANDSLRAHRAHLAEDQFDSLAVHLLSLGLRAWQRYDVSLASGLSRETYSFRAMRGYREGRFTEGPYIDWLRANVRDSRFEDEGSTAVTATGELPDQPVLDVESFEQAVLDASVGLSTRSLWTLHHLAHPITFEGRPTVIVAGELGLDLREALDLLEELETELRRAA